MSSSNYTLTSFNNIYLLVSFMNQLCKSTSIVSMFKINFFDFI